MTISSQTRSQVEALLDRFVEAAGTGDGAALEGVVSPDLTGFWVDRAVRGGAELAEALDGPFGLAGLEVSCEGTIAWVAARMVGSGASAPRGRFTAVLRGTGHAWQIAQVHASLPA